MVNKFERIPKFQGGTEIVCRAIKKTKSGVSLKNCEITFKDRSKRKIIFTSEIKVTEP